jgi:hypothetical protein
VPHHPYLVYGCDEFLRFTKHRLGNPQ